MSKTTTPEATYCPSSTSLPSSSRCSCGAKGGGGDKVLLEGPALLEVGSPALPGTAAPGLAAQRCTCASEQVPSRLLLQADAAVAAGTGTRAGGGAVQLAPPSRSTACRRSRRPPPPARRCRRRRCLRWPGWPGCGHPRTQRGCTEGRGGEVGCVSKPRQGSNGAAGKASIKKEAPVPPAAAAAAAGGPRSSKARAGARPPPPPAPASALQHLAAGASLWGCAS